MSTALKILMVPVIGAFWSIVAPLIFMLVCLSTFLVLGCAWRILTWLICGN